MDTNLKVTFIMFRIAWVVVLCMYVCTVLWRLLEYEEAFNIVYACDPYRPFMCERLRMEYSMREDALWLQVYCGYMLFDSKLVGCVTVLVSLYLQVTFNVHMTELDEAAARLLAEIRMYLIKARGTPDAVSILNDLTDRLSSN